MRLLLSLTLLFSLSVVAEAQPIDIGPTGVSGHHIGESVATFLSIEPKANEALDSCRRNPSQSQCDRILEALDRGHRAEVSVSNSFEFVFDQGKLIKLATLVDGSADSVTITLTKAIGPRASEMDVQKQDSSGARWNDNLSVWNAPDAYILLFQDNNPSLTARHAPVIVVESPAEHARNASNSGKRSNTLKRGLQRVLSKGGPGGVSLDF